MKDLIKVATEIRDAFDYNPGHSDLDNEQPIHVCIPLGTWRRLNYALMNLEPDDGGITQALVQMARDNALAEARTAPEARDTEDAKRYRYLRDYHSRYYPMDVVEPAPAEAVIEWSWQQTKPAEWRGWDAMIDADIARQKARDAEDDGEPPPQPNEPK